jgi:hypothetical protein
VANNLYSDGHLAFYERNGVAPPVNIPHIKEEDIEKHMVKLMPSEWRLEGNTLIGETEYGPLVQVIPPNYILTGTDEEGLPVFKKVS